MAHLRPALVLFVLFSLLTGLAYPMAVTAIATLVFRHQAEGSLLKKDNVVIGSLLIGQTFTSPQYFHGRPSATTAPDPKDPSKSIGSPYNAGQSGGSNLAPTSKALMDGIKNVTSELRATNPMRPVPVDLVTSSASGLDPDITPAGAVFQIKRVAKARNLSEKAVADLVSSHTEARSFGFIGEATVNVLELNLALDALAREPSE